MTNTKLGFHVSTGPRGGYGAAAQAGPALVVSFEAGAFDELPPETVKVYRDVTLWLDTPGGYQQMAPATIRQNVMHGWGPALEERWAPIRSQYQNVCFQPTNEMGANTPEEFAANVALEQAFLDYFTPRGYRLCFLSLSGGDPDLDYWRLNYLPLIRYASNLDAGHIYGRHCYGGVPDGVHNMLTRDGEIVTDNVARPFVEAAILWAENIRVPLAITEAGQNGGYLFPGVPSFGVDAADFDAQLLQVPNILGAALWTYGDYQNRPANIQDASAWLSSYLRERDIAPIVLPTISEPAHKAVVLKAPQEAGVDDWLQIADYGYDKRRTMTASLDDTLSILRAGSEQSFAEIVQPHLPSQVETVAAIEAAGFAWVDVTLDIFPNIFRFSHWPTQHKKINQEFGVNPDYYNQFNLPGHEGIDIMAPDDSPVFAVAPGNVYRVEPAPQGNYGIQVRIAHGDGYRTVYAHLKRAVVEAGMGVAGGQIIGRADSTGNSTGSHLHLTLKKVGSTAAGSRWPYDIIDPTPYLRDDLPIPAAPPTTDPPPAGPTYDIWSYMFPATARQYIVKNANGNQERYYPRSYKAGRIIQKNRDAEYYAADSDFIYLIWDTSPGGARYYVRSKEKDGQAPAPYCPRFMRVGQTWRDSGHYVQFYYKNDCQKSGDNSGNAGQEATLLAVIPDFTTPEGAQVGETIRLSTGAETHYFAKGWGRVGWKSAWGSAWKTPEDVSGQQPEPLQLPPCMSV